MAKLLVPAEKLEKKYNVVNAAESVAMASSSMALNDVKKFLNTGNEFLHISVPDANMAADVTITLSSVAAFDSARVEDMTVTIPKGSVAVVTNLKPLNMGDIVSISTNLSGADTCNAVIINPAAL